MLNKKSIKVISVILLIVMLLMALGNVAFADIEVPSADGNVEVNPSVQNALTSILNIMQWVGIATAVVVAMYLGITYITKSPEGKAEIKKQLPLFIGGIAVVLFASAIVGFIKTSLGA